MLFRLRTTIKKKWFGIYCKNILSTPPLKIKEDGIVIVSMVSHSDLLMYLIAIKSFYNTLNRGKIVIINTVAESLSGWKEGEAVGKHISEVLHLFFIFP